MHGNVQLVHFHPKKMTSWGIKWLAQGQRGNLNQRELKADLLQPWQVPLQRISFSFSAHIIRLPSIGKDIVTAPEQQNLFLPCLPQYNFLTFLYVHWSRCWIPGQQDTQRVLNEKQRRDARRLAAQPSAGEYISRDFSLFGYGFILFEHHLLHVIFYGQASQLWKAEQATSEINLILLS